MALTLAILLLFSPLWCFLIAGTVADRITDRDRDRFERYVRLTWADKHPEEPY
jgi:hypothetical protein